MSMSTVKEGPLFKKGKINTEWRERLFVLNKKQLAYFKGSVSVFSVDVCDKDHTELVSICTAGLAYVYMHACMHMHACMYTCTNYVHTTRHT